MKNKSILLILFLISIGYSQTTSNKENSIYFKETRDTIINNIKFIVWHKKWSDYIIHPRFSNISNKYSLLEINYDEIWNNYSLEEDDDDVIKSINVTKWDYSNNGYNKNVWKFNTKGSVLKIEDNFIKVIQLGCCSKPSTIKYFSINTGKYLTICNTGESIIGSNKYFGYTLFTYLDTIYKLPGKSNYHGVGFLFCDTSIVSYIYIKADTVKNEIPKLYGEFSKKKSTIRLSFNNYNGQKDIFIEINNDSLKIK
jgi:hypothetical protein